MQSPSVACITSNAQEEKTNNVDDDRGHRGEEEQVSTISNENISAQKEMHVKTKRDAPDSIPQPFKRRDRGRGKLSQFPEKVCKEKPYDVVMKRFVIDILVAFSTAFNNCVLVLVQYFASFDHINIPLLTTTIRSSCASWILKSMKPYFRGTRKATQLPFTNLTIL